MAAEGSLCALLVYSVKPASLGQSGIALTAKATLRQPLGALLLQPAPPPPNYRANIRKTLVEKANG